MVETRSECGRRCSTSCSVTCLNCQPAATHRLIVDVKRDGWQYFASNLLLNKVFKSTNTSASIRSNDITLLVRSQGKANAFCNMYSQINYLPRIKRLNRSVLLQCHQSNHPCLQPQRT